VLRLGGTGEDAEAAIMGKRCADVAGFNVHANVRVSANDRRLARADVCPQRANVAAPTSAVRRETARNARADVISGLSPGRAGSATPRYRGQHRCGAIKNPDPAPAPGPTRPVIQGTKLSW
jgi:hypothetical protein